jgi:hypothetical protein
MHKSNQPILRHSLLNVFATSALFCSVTHAQAQNPEMQQRLAEIKQSSAANKQALARYTWAEQQTIRLKGEAKKTQQLQVRIGPDGQQQKIGAESTGGASAQRRTIQATHCCKGD